MPRFLDVSDTSVARTALGVTARQQHLVSLADYLAAGESLPNDGLTDAAPLIQEALDDLLDKATGSQPYGDICYMLDIPAGLYRTEASIRPGGVSPTQTVANIGIRGAGRDQTFILPQANTSGVVFNAVPDDSDPVASNCHFADFTIDMVDSTLGPSGESRKGFIGRGFEDCTFSRITVKNSPATAFGVDFPIRCVFDDCKAETTGPGGVNGTLDMGGGVVEAARYWSGFGIGMGVFEGESVLFINCEATDCYRGGFFFEAYEAADGNDRRDAVIQLIGCRSYNNRIGITNVGIGSLVATNCRIEDNTVCGVFSGVTGVSQEKAALDITLDNCQILRSEYGVYATGDYTTRDAFRGPSVLNNILGGHRILNCRIEDNDLAGIYAEDFRTIERGGLTIRGNHFRRNGPAIKMVNVVGPLRDLVIADNYFDANDDTAVDIRAALNCPVITGNVFCNSADFAATGLPQVNGIVWHPAEPVSVPLVSGNVFRRITNPMVNDEHLRLGDVEDQILGNTEDTTNPWIYREELFGGEDTTWPAGGDGWSKVSTGSNADWLRTSVGIVKGGAGSAISYIYRDLSETGVYVEGRITRTVSGDTSAESQFLGVMLSLASSSGRTAVVAGVNKAAAGDNGEGSDFYALWQVVGGTWTRLWESDVPYGESHSIALGRLEDSTVTDVFIDGALVHSVDISSVASTSLAGVCGDVVADRSRYMSEWRAMTYTETTPAATGPDALVVSDFAGSAIVTSSETVLGNDSNSSLPTTAAVIDAILLATSSLAPGAYVPGGHYFFNSPGGNSTSSGLTADRARTSAALIITSVDIEALTAEFTVAGDAASVFRVCIWADDGFGRPGELVIDAGTISTGTGDAGDVATGGTPGHYSIDVTLTLEPGLYHVGGIVQGVSSTQPTMRLVDYRQAIHTGPAGSSPASNRVGTGWYKDGFSAAAGDISSPTKNTSQSQSPPRIGFIVASAGS